MSAVISISSDYRHILIITHLTNSWMCIGVLKYQEYPQAEPDTASTSKNVKNRFPAKFFSRKTAYGVAQNLA